MSIASTSLPPGFDPWTQPVTLFNQDGSNFTVGMEDFNQGHIFTARLAITYGTQIGASLMLLLVLLLLTRASKRTSSIFLINALCLTANTVRCILLSCYMTSTLLHPYSQFTANYSRVTRGDLATSTAANTFTLLVTILVMVSLSLQVWVVCITTAAVQRYIIMSATTIMACIATGYKAAFVILNIKQTLNLQNLQPYNDIVLKSYITQAVAIWFFSCIFTYKLGYAIIQRRKLKMPQFGPMQIVFIMGCQTMLIPAIFACLQFLEDTTNELGAISLTMVCIFLPLSAIWAGVVNETAIATRGPDSHHRLIQGEFYRSAPNSTVGSNASTSAMENSRQMSVCTCATECKGNDIAATTPKKGRAEYDDDGIYIGREFGFSRDEASDRV